MVGDGIGLVEVLLGLPGFRVLDVVETDVEVVVTVETTAEFTGCSRCGVRAEAQDRMSVQLRDLPCFGPAGSAGVDQAAVAVPRLGLFGANVDGDLGAHRRPGGVDPPGGGGGLPPGR